MILIRLIFWFFLSNLVLGLIHIPVMIKLAGSVLPAGLALYEYFNCHTFECCNDRWIARNETLLKTVLKEQLYGQPFAAKVNSFTICYLKVVRLFGELKCVPAVLSSSQGTNI